MKVLIQPEYPPRGAATLTFFAYEDSVYALCSDSLTARRSTFPRLSMANWVLRYNFTHQNFSLIKNRYNINTSKVVEALLSGIKLTPDFRIANDRDLTWFTLQYQNLQVDKVIDCQDLSLDEDLT